MTCFLLLFATRAHRHAGRVGDVLGDVRKVLVVEVGRQLQVVGAGEGGVGGRQILDGSAVSAPVHVPASVSLGAQPVQGHAHLLRLGLLRLPGGLRYACENDGGHNSKERFAGGVATFSVVAYRLLSAVRQGGKRLG